jgi:hypothetical protein
MTIRHNNLTGCCLLVLLGAWTAGCSLFQSPHSPESSASAHMDAAEAFEKAGDLGNATREYSAVASMYPGTPEYAHAIWKAADLYLNIQNPAANDSAALSLLSLYLNLPVSDGTKPEARLRHSLLERVVALKGSLVQMQHNVDSLAAVTKKQSTTLSSQSTRLTELENELHQTKDELARLKELDVRLSRLHQRR